MSNNRKIILGESLKRIIIAGWHHDSNKGDAAILKGLILFLRNNCPCQIDIYLHMPPEEPCWRSALKHTRVDIPDLNVLAPLLHLRKLHLPLLKIIWAGYMILRCGLLLLSPKFARVFLTKSERETLNSFQKCDMLIGKGGHYLYDLGSLSSMFSLLNQFFPFLLALRLRKPYVFAGISIGPFRSLLSKFIAKLVFNHAVAISVREQDSFNILNGMGISKNVMLSTDLAFYLLHNFTLSNNFRETDGLHIKKILIIPRALFPDDVNGRKFAKYIQTLAKMIDKLSASYEITLATTATDVEGGEDDTRAALAVLNNLTKKNVVRFIRCDLDPISVIKMISEYDLIVGTRLHSVIFALMAERPFLGISYFGPKMSIVKDLGLGDLLIHIEHLDENMLELKICGVLNKFDHWKKVIRVAKQRAYEMVLSDQALRKMVAMLAHPDCSSAISHASEGSSH